ncbi:MAG: murG [Candidatus Midichloriaceae bacterium]|jgi:UDP-N-acetylglucosamine--N-acetylmuramyl-(pentapeptide) pyrophosphoryl-undecaprenol N-acetylglucosamine transferase|nr:murG [Candidatus Midichloriaceae bacterium]
MKKGDVVVLAAGGTGGHFFPAQALAEELLEHGYKPLLICDQRTKEFLRGGLAKIDNIKIFAPKPSKNIIANALHFLKLIPVIFKLWSLFKKKRVSAVVGFGGYPSFPTLLAALGLRVPIYIHEQNAVLGRVNRLFLPFMSKLFLSFPHTIKIPNRYASKAIVVGNLVRKSVLNFAQKSACDHNNINILVIGGSQGAKIFSDVVPFSIKLLPEELQAKLKIYQQARNNLVAETKRLYKATKSKVEVRSFFENIGELMFNADLIICRSGASTVTEIAIMGKPAIFIPLKIATDNHQYYNAKLLSDAGGAIIFDENDLTAELLAKTLTDILTSSKRLQTMAKKSGQMAILGAAEKIRKAMG